MKYRTYKFRFKDGTIKVRFIGYNSAKVLAQAEAIKRGWDYTVL